MIAYMKHSTAATTNVLRAILARRNSHRLLSSSLVPSWATYDPAALGKDSTPYAVSNMVGGNWTGASSTMEIIHPLDRDANPIFTIPDTTKGEIEPFVKSLRACPKTGLHNPLKNPQRYVEYGEISRKVRDITVLKCLRGPSQNFFP